MLCCLLRLGDGGVDVEATNVSFCLISKAPCAHGSRRYTGPGLVPLSLSSQRTHSISYNDALASGVEIGDEGVVAAFEVVAEVSERCVSVCSLKLLADILPTVSRLPGAQATVSPMPAQSTD